MTGYFSRGLNLNNHSKKQKGAFVAKVRENRRLKEKFYRLVLELTGVGAEAFARTNPGQFAQLDLSKTALPPQVEVPAELADSSQRRILLRRPFSFCNITVEGKKTLVSILYCVVGPASLRMTTLAAGDSLSVVGPVGNGFAMPVNKKEAVLVLGGTGAGPLIHLARKLSADYPDMEIIAIVGAKSAELLPFEDAVDKITVEASLCLSEFAESGVKAIVSTDDGSAGSCGLVTDCLEKWLNRPGTRDSRDMIIYSCGPEAMQAAVAKIAHENKIECKVSLERMMACGIGLCQSCAVECRAAESDETVYKMCCKDGPVFDSKEVVF